MDANTNREWTRMDANSECLSGCWRLALKTRGVVREGYGRSCRDLFDIAKGGDGAKSEAAIEYSPGLQPCVTSWWGEAHLHDDREPRPTKEGPPLRFPYLSAYGLKPWAVLYNRFRLRPISPFSYVRQVAVRAPDSQCLGSWWRPFQSTRKRHRTRYTGVFRRRRETPVLQHSITPFARIRGQLVRRSLSSMSSPAEGRPRKRGALHNDGLAKSEGRVRSRPCAT